MKITEMMKMKKPLMTLVLLPLMALADTETVDGITWTYTINNGEAGVGAGSYQQTAISTSTKGAIVIPAILGGYPVTSIGSGAFYGCSGLTSVTIPGGVKSIGWYAFYGCSGLLSVAIPSSVTSVGGYAFEGCSGLTRVDISDLFRWCECGFVGYKSNPLYYAHHLYLNGEEITDLIIPSNVTGIGDNAFPGCEGLTSVTIPEGVTSIRDYAFYGCSGLTSVSIPSSVTSIGYNAFSDCSGLTRVDISDLSKWCERVVGYKSNPLCYAHHLYLNGEEIADLIIPSSVTSIGSGAFYGCSGLTSVTIPSSVTNIGSSAFYGCSGLTSVTIPEGVTSIGDNAFYNCGGLMSVTISSSVTNIGDHAFYCCPDLTSVAIPEGVTSIGDYAFNSCRSLTCVAIPSSVISIGACAFWQCNIEVVVVPEEPQECVIQCFGTQMWYQRAGAPIQYEWSYSKVNNNEATITGVRPAYGDVEIPSQIGGLTVTRIGERAFESCRGLTSVKIPSSVMHIGDDAFGSCDGLTSMRIPDGVTSIGDYVFYGCVMLEDVWFADSVLTMGRSMFTKCARLSSVRLPAKIDVIPDGMFCDCWALSSVEIPAGVKAIGEMSFQHCDAIECLVIPASVENISPEAFRGSSFSVTVVEGNKKFQVDNGVLYDKGCERLIFCPTCISGKFTCPASVRRIDAAAFYECTDMTSIDIGDGVMTIGGRAFEDCKNLQEVTLPKNITAVEDSVFSGCSALTSLGVPKGVVKIASYAFAGCTSLKYLSLPSTVEDITRMFAWGVSGADTILFKGLPPKGLDTITSQKINRILYNSQFTSEWLEAAEAAGLCNLEPACLVDVTFVGNGGAFANPAGESCVCEQIVDTAYSLPPYEPVRKGYRFGGYWTEANGGTRVTSGVSVKLTKAHSLYAHWTVGQSVTVRFNATGGTVEPEERVYVSEAPFGEFPVPTREHYDFAGWFTEASGGTQVTAASEVPLADRELFAHWTAKQYAIRFHANDGTERTTDQAFVYGATVTLAKNGFVRTGYTFAGWAVAEGSDSTAYADGATLEDVSAIQDGVINLYAVWTANGYEVRFDANGGDGTMEPQVFAYGEVKALRVNAFVRDGYAFVGWNLSAPRSEAAAGTVSDGAVVSNLTAEAGGVVALCAQWSRNGWRIVPGEKIEWDTELKGYTASGLPKGLSYSKSAGKITGTVKATTKPGEYTVTFKNSGEADETRTIVVTAVPKLSVALVGSGTGKVSGAGEHLASAKVTLKATADAKDAAATVKSAFAGWFADADCTQPLDSTVDYRTASFPFVMPTEDVMIYAKFIPVAEDWVSVWCQSADEYARGVEIEPLAVAVGSASLATVKVTGLPTGLKFTAKPLTLKATNNRAAVDLPANTIYGTPTKSGIYTATITATTAGKKSETYKVDFVVRGDGEYLVDVMGIDGADYPDNGSDAQHAIQWGKMSGYGVFAPEKAATLKATANKGYVFAGWFSDVACVCAGGDEDDGCVYTPAEGSVDYRSTSFPVKVGYEDVLYFARFVRAEDDDMLYANVEDAYYLNGAWSLTLDIESLSLPTVTVKGLPSGLKFDAKTLTISGTPTKPGTYPVTLTLKNKTITKAKTQKFTLYVANIESPYLDGVNYANDAYVYRVGTSMGFDIGSCARNGYSVTGVSGLPSGLKFDKNSGLITGVPTKAGPKTVTITLKNGKLTSSATITLNVDAIDTWAYGAFDGGGEDGVLTLTVGNTGKISGKWMTVDGTWTLSAKSYESYDEDEQGCYRSLVEAKCGTETMKFWLDAYDGRLDLYECLPTLCGYGPLVATAKRNVWKEDQWKTLAAQMKGASFALTDEVSLKVGTSGAVTATGKFVTGQNAMGKDIVYSASCSTVLVPVAEDSFMLYLCFPRKDGKFGGMALQDVLEWNGGELAIGCAACREGFYCSGGFVKICAE